MTNFRTVFFLLLSGFSSLVMGADTAKEVKRYFKCYAHFTRERLPENDLNLSKVKSGLISGTDACMAVLSKADLSESSGEIMKSAGEYNSVGKKVLKTFNDFHRTWFSNVSYENELVACVRGTYEIYDNGDMAYYPTMSLFGQKAYSEVVTSDTPIEAIRNSDYTRTNRFLRSTGATRRLIIGNSKGNSFPENARFETWENVPLVETGELVGLKEKAPFLENRMINRSNLMADYIDIFKNHGAGAVSTPSYFMNNLGMRFAAVTDGGIKVHRRWAKNVISDLLCRDIPVIRTTDAIKYVDTTGSSSLSFRVGISCMQCHATMDQMARTTRNIKKDIAASTCNGGNFGESPMLIGEAEQTMGPHGNEYTGWIDQADSNFYKRPPNGRLLYRTTKGDLIDKKVDGLDELGDALADNDDLYTCAAKRYVRFFTGVDVPMFDPGDINAPSVSDGQKAYVKYIQDLGSDLKKTGNSKDLIKAIISSDMYLQPGKKP